MKLKTSAARAAITMSLVAAMLPAAALAQNIATVNGKAVPKSRVDMLISQAGDDSEVQRLLAVLQHPFDEQTQHEADAGFPPDWAQQLEVSCSS